MPEKFATKFRSAMVFGKIEIVEDAEEKRMGISAIAEKFSPDYHDEGVKLSLIHIFLQRRLYS